MPLWAQWAKVPLDAIPRTADGKPNLSAPAPRLPDGKPDLSGVWSPNANRFLRDIAVDLKPGEVPYQPWAKALYESRVDGSHSKEDPDAKLVIANPEIVRTEGRHTQNEGCLSIPEFREPVARARKVTIRAQDVNGKWFEKTGEDLLARAFLHETDHLNGKLYISHISALKRDFMKRKIRKLMKAGEW